MTFVYSEFVFSKLLANLSNFIKFCRKFGQVWITCAKFSPKSVDDDNMWYFFRRDALKEQFGKEPNRVSCLAVKSALLGTRHPRKEKEAALQSVTGEPACQYCRVTPYSGENLSL